MKKFPNARMCERSDLAILAILLACGCQPAKSVVDSDVPAEHASHSATHAPATSIPTPQVAGPPTASTHSTVASVPLAFSHDDFEAALARAKARNALLFVDAWAEWCHTCLSMESVVLNDPSLGAFQQSYEFVALDTEKPENADFVQRFSMDTWPTFFVLRPRDLELIGYWPGAGSVREMRDFLQQSLDASAALDSQSVPEYLRDFLAARRAQSVGKDAEAATLYARAYQAAPASWPRRSELVLGYIRALLQQKRFEDCARLGATHLDEVTGAARPAQFAQRYFSCLGQLSSRRQGEVERVVNRLRELAHAPTSDMSHDDQVDTLNILATVLTMLGHSAEAAEVLRVKLEAAERGALAAKNPAQAQAFDRVRALSYAESGRVAEAIELLKQRERELPHSYAAPALLAEIHYQARDHERAVAALLRAAENAEGPRQATYLERGARWLSERGDKRRELELLERLIVIRGSLRGTDNAQRLERARARRDELSKELER